MRSRELTLLLAAGALLGSGSQRVAAATFTVTNLNDSGAGSLRQAVIDSNLAPGTDTIDFQAGLAGAIILDAGFPSGQLSITGSLDLQGPGATVLIDLMFNEDTDAMGWGAMTEERWQQQIDLFEQLGQFEGETPSVDDIMTADVLEATQDARDTGASR